MRFLITSKSKMMPPPESVPALMDAMKEWMEKYTKSGTMEQTWSFVGIPGGGGIVSVASLEELDGMMAEYPFRPFSEVHVQPIVELGPSIERDRAVAERVAQSVEATFG